MYASLDCGALSAKCTAGPTILGLFWVPWTWHSTLQNPPLLKPPFLGSWPTIIQILGVAATLAILRVMMVCCLLFSLSLPYKVQQSNSKLLYAACSTHWSFGFACASNKTRREENSNWGQKKYSQEFVFPSLGEVRVNFGGEFLLKPFVLWIEGPNCSDNSWEGFGWFFAIERLLGSPK